MGGIHPQFSNTYLTKETSPPNVKELLLQHDHVISQLKIQLQKAQQYMKATTDTKQRDVQFEIGDMVLVKLQPYRQQSLQLRKNHKLNLCFFGHFPIIVKIGPIAYKLQLPTSTKIHPFFHCSHLKTCKGDHDRAYVPLPMINNPNSLYFEDKVALDADVIVMTSQAMQGGNTNTAHVEDKSVRHITFKKKNRSPRPLHLHSLLLSSLSFSEALPSL